ncbi:MAG: hypothetical protein Q4C61_06610 [Lachnospiraceae bacterium]|nr:hypothetical protein [Lachnospiraceae bacterium]
MRSKGMAEAEGKRAVNRNAAVNDNLTINMKKQFREKSSGLKYLYCREDVKTALDAVKRAKKDNVRFRKNDLVKICRAVGLDADALLKNPNLLYAVPNRAERKKELLEIFHDVYRSFPDSSDYMTRIVRRLAPEYKEDTVRTAILKKFVLGGGVQRKVFRTEAILAWAVGQMSEEERNKYADSDEEQKLALAVSKLEDGIFSKEHMEIELNRLDILRIMIKLLERWASDLDIVDAEGKSCGFPGLQITEKTEKALYGFCWKYRLPVFQEYGITDILRIIAEAYEKGKLPEAEAEMQMESFFELLQADFMLQAGNTYYLNSKGTVKKAAELYEQSKKDVRKKKREDWKLLRLCDDLASGNFKTNNGQTRVYLYYFAIMFDMSVSLQRMEAYDSEEDGRNLETDIEKNLFEDYYNDNLIRFLREEYADPQYASSYEREPTGDGINYKNFAEAVYLYYLYHKEWKLTPGERIARAERMIDRCIARAQKPGALLPEALPGSTLTYKERYVTEVLRLPEKKLPDYILKNYLVRVPSGTLSGSRTRISAETNTANKRIKKIMEELEEVYADSVNIAQTLALDSDYPTDDYTEEAAFVNNLAVDWKLADALRREYAEEKDFIRVVNNLDARLSAEINWLGIRKKKFFAALLYALYYNSSADYPVKIEALKNIVKKTDVTIDGLMILKGAKQLWQMGFDVHQIPDKNGDSMFYLGSRRYQDERLNRVMQRISCIKGPDEAVLLRQMGEIMEAELPQSRRVSRSTLIAACMSYYVVKLQDEEIESFSELYDDFTSSVNPILRECRFQPLSEKNILDMYVLLSLYFYIVENGK